MVLNNKGQAIFLYFMIGVTIIVLAMAFAPVVKQFNDSARNETTENQVGLNCSSTLISDWDKANCTILDMGLPYFILGLIAIGGAVLVGKSLI